MSVIFYGNAPSWSRLYRFFSSSFSLFNAVRRGTNRLVSVNFLPAVKTVAAVKHEIPAFPQGQRDAPLCGFVGLNGGNFWRSFVRHFVKPGFRRHDAWLPCMRHSPERSDAYTRHRIQHQKNVHVVTGDEPTAVTWHQRRLICSPQFCPSRNSARPYRGSASYGGCEPHISAVQPFQVMTTRRRFSQVTETLACRHPNALVSSCAILPGNIGAGLPYSEQTPLPKASVHAVK